MYDSIDTIIYNIKNKTRSFNPILKTWNFYKDLYSMTLLNEIIKMKEILYDK